MPKLGPIKISGKMERLTRYLTSEEHIIFFTGRLERIKASVVAAKEAEARGISVNFWYSSRWGSSPRIIVTRPFPTITEEKS